MDSYQRSGQQALPVYVVITGVSYKVIVRVRLQVDKTNTVVQSNGSRFLFLFGLLPMVQYIKVHLVIYII